MVLADWLMSNDCPDPAAHLRGTYCDEAGYRDLIAKRGGLVELVGSCVDPFCDRVSVPEEGDIGVVGSTSNARRQFGAIFDGARWVVRTAGGFVAVSAKPVAIWRLNCRT
ncbi:hypothetical protein [Nostoc phage Nsp-JY10]